MRFWRNPSLYFLFLLSISFSVIPGYSYYRFLSYDSRLPSYRELPGWFSNIPVALYPEKVTEVAVPAITAEGVFILDVDSAVPMYEHNAQTMFAPASTTKIMTALVALETYQLDEVLTIPDLPFSGSLMRLVPKERITVDNLLYGLLVNSGNDAADVLAYTYPGGREEFIARMNQKAAEIGLQKTQFKNPSGLPETGHFMSAWDLGHLAAYAMRNETFTKYVKTKEKIVYGVSGERHVLKSTNKLLDEIAGLDGVKTGYTEEAGEVLVSTVKRGDHRIVVVLLKSADRFGETKSLVEWVFANHEWRDILGFH